MSLLNKPQTEWDDELIRQVRPPRWWRKRKFWVWAAIIVVSILIVALSARYIRV
jgi:hypothetical protein